LSRLIQPSGPPSRVGKRAESMSKLDSTGLPQQGIMLEGRGGERQIREYPDQCLREVCGKVEIGGIAAQSVVDALKATWKPGMAGLAAPQIGLPYRAIAVAERDSYRIFLNPEVVERSPNVIRGPEACLSIPFVMAEVDRAEWVVFTAVDPAMGEVKLLAHGMQSVIMQHEIDHLDGILFIDHLTAKDRRRVLKEAASLRMAMPKKPVIEVAGAA